MYSERHVFPCGCGYPFCFVVILSNHEETNIIYRIFYGDYSVHTTFFERLKHWIKEGRKIEFEYDITIQADDLKILMQKDPSVKNFEESQIPGHKHITDKIGFNKKDLSWKDFWEYLTTGGIQKKMLRCIDKEGTHSYLLNIDF